MTARTPGTLPDPKFPDTHRIPHFEDLGVGQPGIRHMRLYRGKATSVFLRGAESDQVLVLIDGRRYLGRNGIGDFNLEDLDTDGRQFDHLFADGETFRVGDIDGRVIATPGHTPACVAYVIGDSAYVGDTLFMPDFGTARADFPGGDAGTL